jgi:hypothetical protein
MNVKSCCALAVCCVLVCLGLSVSLKSKGFRSLKQAKAELEAAGYYCCSDREDGKVDAGGFLVSREKWTSQEVNQITRSRPIGSQSKTIAWVTMRELEHIQLWSVPVCADVRVWGNVLVMGDRSFIDEIESSLQRRN